MITKTFKYEENYRSFETEIYNFISTNWVSEIHFFYSCYCQYSIIINDQLNIPLEKNSSLNLKDNNELESVIDFYKKLMTNLYENYLNENLDYDFMLKI